jgi:hypothetical protein
MTSVDFLLFIFYVILFFAGLIGVLHLGSKVKKTYFTLKRAEFYAKQKYCLLEINIPRGKSKSPLAMELFLNALIQGGGESSWMDKWLKGSTKSWFSLEMISNEGKVGFYIWTKENFSKIIQTQLYAQFPDIGIKEVYQGDYRNDYVAKFEYDLSKYKFSCSEFKKKNAGHLPIRTYVDYGLDKDPKEEFKVDPITPVLEYLGSLGQGEQAWIQIGIKVPGKETEKPAPTDPKEKAKFKKDNKLKWYQSVAMVDWTDAAKADILKLNKRDKKVDKDTPVNPADTRLTEQEKEKITAIERSLSKAAFDTTIRTIYFADKDHFKAENSAGLGGVFKQYNTMHLNSFESKSPSVKYAWQDKGNLRVEGDKKQIFEQYKYRAFFYKEFIPVGGMGKWKSNFYKSEKDKYKAGTPFITTIEELATIFHFPGDTAKTSGVARVEAKKVEAPANLPI